MKMRLLLFITTGMLFFTSSCFVETIDNEEYVTDLTFNTEALLQSYDLWYIDINQVSGTGEVPFLQQAFTMSFVNGIVFANNNLVGIGKTGNGLGIEIGSYDILEEEITIHHNVDGIWRLEVRELSNNSLELYHAISNTSYFILGFSRNNFDYETLLYDNIHYFLQEYDVWEKMYASTEGEANEFDNETFLQFLTVENQFRSSVDPHGTLLENLIWDYEGEYEVFDVADRPDAKILTLDYDYLNNDYFELYVINDGTIELYHVQSGTTYQFAGIGFVQYLKQGVEFGKKRMKKANGVKNVSLMRNSPN